MKRSSASASSSRFASDSKLKTKKALSDELKDLRSGLKLAASVSDRWDSAVSDTKSAIQLLGLMPDENAYWDNAMEALEELLEYNTDKAKSAEERYVTALEKFESVNKKIKKA